MLETQIQKLTKAIHEAKHIAVLSGAGISTASGIPDFRSENGIYTKVKNVEYLLSEDYYYSQPKAFWKSFKDIFFMNHIHEYDLNIGHNWLAELERLGKRITIITQNIDGLHRKAGSTEILEVHGSIDHAHCPKCKRVYPLDELLQAEVPRCTEDHFILKSDVVLFGGMVKHLEEAYQAVLECDLFLTLGSSLQVYPVKELPYYAKQRRHGQSAIINLQSTDMDDLFDIVIHDDIVTTFEQLKKQYN